MKILKSLLKICYDKALSMLCPYVGEISAKYCKRMSGFYHENLLKFTARFTSMVMYCTEMLEPRETFINYDKRKTQKIVFPSFCLFLDVTKPFSPTQETTNHKNKNILMLIEP